MLEVDLGPYQPLRAHLQPDTALLPWASRRNAGNGTTKIADAFEIKPEQAPLVHQNANMQIVHNRLQITSTQKAFHNTNTVSYLYTAVMG